MRITLAEAQAGDAVFFDSPGPVSWILKVAQRIRWHGDKNHVALLDHKDKTGQWIVCQAEGCGVTNDKPLVLGPKDVIIANPGSRQRTLRFARAQVGRKYGYLTILSIFLTELSPRFVNVMAPDTWICSALVAEAFRFGGWYHGFPDIYQVSPDQLWEALP